MCPGARWSGDLMWGAVVSISGMQECEECGGGTTGDWDQDTPGYSPDIEPPPASPAQPSPARGSAPSVLIETPATSCRDSDSTMMTTLKWTPGYRALMHTFYIIYTPTPCKMCLVAVPGGSMRCAIFTSLSDSRDTGY